MAKTEITDLNSQLQIRGIELLGCSMQTPPAPDTPLTNLNFDIHLESRADAQNRLVFMIVDVEIKNEDPYFEIGYISASCIFEIANFDSMIKTDATGNATIPQPLLDLLTSISVSTTRGVMYSTFKGTVLHGAILPIIDPKQFRAGNH